MYEIFEQLLKERGLSIAEFSRLTGIAKSTLSDWKKGKFQLKDSKRRVIADFFDVTLDYLDGRTTDRQAVSSSYEIFVPNSKPDASDKYAKMHQQYDVFIKLSEDSDLYALVERAQKNPDYRERLMKIAELLESDK